MKLQNQEITLGREFQKGIANYFVIVDGEFQLRRHRGHFRLSLDGLSVEARDEHGRRDYRFCAIDNFVELWSL